jgi:hypothetical protein
MKSYKIFSASLALLLGWNGAVFAQSEADALRYTRLGISGSARIQGIGGAQAALGADISTLAVNPAGLGLFRRSEVSGSVGISAFNSKAGILNDQLNSGPTATSDRTTLNIPQAGFVLSNRKDDSEGGDWRGITIGLSYSRLNNFNQQLNYSNTAVPPNSIVDYFSELANSNGRTEQSLDNEFGDFLSLEGLAYGTYLINFRDNFGKVTTDAQPLWSFGDIPQQEEILRRGSQNQIDFGIGTSYKDKIYLGASVGIVTSRFTQERTFKESGEYEARYNDKGLPNLIATYKLNLRDEFTSEGAGINLKVGAIFRPVDIVRLGVSIQTPTAYNFSEIYQRTLSATTINTSTERYETFTESEIPGEFSYNLLTPFRATGGAAVFLNKYGFITADVEYVNYPGMRFSENDEFGSTGDYFSVINRNIETTYRSAFNYKIGAEGRYDIFRFRAGYVLSGSPYKNPGFDGKINTYTLGAGIRLQNFYVDAAYTASDNINSRYSPYTLSNGNAPLVNITDNLTNVVFTVGYNF